MSTACLKLSKQSKQKKNLAKGQTTKTQICEKPEYCQGTRKKYENGNKATFCRKIKAKKRNKAAGAVDSIIVLHRARREQIEEDGDKETSGGNELIAPGVAV